MMLLLFVKLTYDFIIFLSVNLYLFIDCVVNLIVDFAINPYLFLIIRQFVHKCSGRRNDYSILTVCIEYIEHTVLIEIFHIRRRIALHETESLGLVVCRLRKRIRLRNCLVLCSDQSIVLSDDCILFCNVGIVFRYQIVSSDY